jgi:hypothetical protein
LQEKISFFVNRERCSCVFSYDGLLLLGNSRSLQSHKRRNFGMIVMKPRSTLSTLKTLSAGLGGTFSLFEAMEKVAELTARQEMEAVHRRKRPEDRASQRGAFMARAASGSLALHAAR